MKVSCPAVKKRIKKEVCHIIRESHKYEGTDFSPRQIKKCDRCSLRYDRPLTLDDMMHIDMIDGEF